MRGARGDALLAVCTFLAALIATACGAGEFDAASDDLRGAAPRASGAPSQPMAGAAPASSVGTALPSGCPGEGTTAPDRLRCTGLFDASGTLLAPSVKEYTPAYALWSDGAVKRRFVLLPNGARIDTTQMDEWVFPIGTKLWKDFVLDGNRIETRFMWKTGAASWVQTTYRWNDAQNDATRLDSGAIIARADGSSYEIPPSGRCEDCHGGRVDKVLGFDAILLGLPGAKGVTLQSLANEGRLTSAPRASWFVIPDEGRQAAPALGWLHANCGVSCHNASEGALAKSRGMVLRLSYDELNPTDGTVPSLSSLSALRTTVRVAASRPSEEFMRIAPGNVAGSAVSALASRRDPTSPMAQMPPLGTRIVDVDGVAAVQRFIAALPVGE